MWGGIALGGYVLFQFFSDYVSRSEVIAVIVAVNAIVTITLWREAARKPPRPNKKFLNELLDSEPITPKHERLKTAGGDFGSMARDVDKRFFADFAPFADIVNEWLADEYVGSHWRLQELAEGDVRLNVDFSDGPRLGRCYAVFHNQVELGRLEIRPGYKYSAETPKVLTEIELGSVRLLSFDSIGDFLSAIAMCVCDDKAKYEEDEYHTNTNQVIVGALTKALWQSQQITEFADLDGQDWGELSLHLQGRASAWYIDQREALQAKRRGGKS
jgi:hypothetical protein